MPFQHTKGLTPSKRVGSSLSNPVTSGQSRQAMLSNHRQGAYSYDSDDESELTPLECSRECTPPIQLPDRVVYDPPWGKVALGCSVGQMSHATSESDEDNNRLGQRYRQTGRSTVFSLFSLSLNASFCSFSGTVFLWSVIKQQIIHICRNRIVACNNLCLYCSNYEVVIIMNLVKITTYFLRFLVVYVSF